MSQDAVKQSRFSGLSRALAFLLLGLSAACGDVGDSSAVPGEDSGIGVSEDATLPIGEGADGTVGPNLAESGAADSPVTPTDTGAPGTDDSGMSADAASDASDDSGATDSGAIDDATADMSAPADSGVADTGVVVDSSTPVDSSVADSTSDSGAPVEAGSSDASKGTLVPCTASGQTDCVQCEGNVNDAGICTATSCLCTPTEATLVQYDIAKGFATAAGPDPATSCYSCLFQVGVLDDAVYGDMGHECGDLPAASRAACVTTMSCILGSSCAKTEVSACYCGTAPTSGTCTSGGANGACEAVEATGLGFAETDGLDILKNFTSTQLASGVANNVFQGAISNNCLVCLQ